MQKIKPYKKNYDYSYALGISPTLELLGAQPDSVSVVLVSSKSEDSTGVERIKKLCQAHGIPCEEDDKTLTRLAKADNCYAVGVFTKYASNLAADAPHVILAQPSDMGNLGTIARTMLGFGCKDLAIIQPGADIFDPKAIRASMGAVFRLRVAYFVTIEAYIRAYPRQLYLFALGSEGNLTSQSFEAPYGLVFGSEGSGLPNSYLELGQTVTIEQSNEIDSFNVSVAAGIALHHAYVQGLGE